MAVVPPPPSLDNIVCSTPVVCEILDDDVDDAYYFLRNNKWPLPDDVTINLWRAVFKKQWTTNKHNNGFLLKDNGVIVGVHCAIYSVQKVHGLSREFCNFATCFVLKEYRGYTLKLIGTTLEQKELIFTSHSIRKDLLPLHKKLGFVGYKNVKLIFIPHYPTFSWLFSKIKYHVDIGLIKDELDYKVTSVSNSYLGIDRIKQALFEINGKY